MKAMCIIGSEKAKRATYFGVARCTRVAVVHEQHLKVSIDEYLEVLEVFKHQTGL